MSYCHVSAQIAEYADQCEDETCPECDSDELEVSSLAGMWWKKCNECGYYEDNEPDYELPR